MAYPLDKFHNTDILTPDAFNGLLYEALSQRFLDTQDPVPFGPDAYYLRVPDKDDPLLIISDYSTVYGPHPEYRATQQETHDAVLKAREAIFDIQPIYESESVMLFKPYSLRRTTIMGAAVMRHSGIDMSGWNPVMTTGQGTLIERPQEHPAALLAVRYLIDAT